MTTTDLIVLAVVYGIPFGVAAYATILTNRAIQAVRKMDAEENSK